MVVVDKTTTHYTAMKDWKVATRLRSYGKYVEAKEKMLQAEPALSNHGEFLLEFGILLKLSGDYTGAIDRLTRANALISDPYLNTSLGYCYQQSGDFKRAEASYLAGFYMVPYKFYALYLLAKLYETNGETAKAVVVAHEILKKEVKVPSSAIVEMVTDMKRLANGNAGNSGSGAAKKCLDFDR